MDAKKERSRAYPVLDLGTSCQILREKLAGLGAEPVDREELANRLGYLSGVGGVAARKIAALVHYGLLRRSHSGSYSLDRLGFQILRYPPDSPEALAARRNALEQPVLFRGILDAYREKGRLPLDLARILAREHGITERASEDAADVFVRSAIFAHVLDPDGTTFLASPAPSVEAPAGPPLPSEEERKLLAGHRIQLPLTGLKSAWLVLPQGATEKDLAELDDWWQKLGVAKLRTYLGLDVREPANLRLVRSKREPDEPERS